MVKKERQEQERKKKPEDNPMDDSVDLFRGFTFDLEAYFGDTDKDHDYAMWTRRRAAATAARIREIDEEENARGNFRKNMVCMYWLRDRCNSGDRCRYLHVLDYQRVKLCQYFVQGAPCPDGNNCIFRHEVMPHEKVRAPRVDPLRARAGAASASLATDSGV